MKPWLENIGRLFLIYLAITFASVVAFFVMYEWYQVFRGLQ